MRIVIDLQPAQSASRFRGIGRYSLSLAIHMAKNAGNHDIWLALNASLPESIDAIRGAFKDLIPADHIRVFDAPQPNSENHRDHLLRARAAEKIRECFLQQLKPDVVHVSSLFEGYVDNAVTSIGAFAPRLNTAVTLYDLIPFLDQERYLFDESVRSYYFRKLRSLRNADLLLAISDYSRREAIDALQLSEHSVLNISAAVDERFRPIDLTLGQAEGLRRRHGIKRRVIFYSPGGDDPRKNIDGLVRAYALLPTEIRATHQLVVSSQIGEEQHRKLSQLRSETGLTKDELVMTGHVSDEDLVLLYNLAELFVLPSKHEGFGLPALEAMACGTPSIGSNTTSVPEAIGWDAALFDPHSPQAIADKMAFVLTDDAIRGQLRDHGLKHARKHSWDASAKIAVTALESLHDEREARPAPVISLYRRPKLAYVSPLPPAQSGISDYSADLLPQLARHYDIDVIVAQGQISDPWIAANCAVRGVAWFDDNADSYDRILYHFGNSPFHAHMFGLVSRHPGIVVLHDFFLSSVLAHEELVGGARGFWGNSLYHAHGYRALQERYEADGVSSAKDRYPCNLQVLQDARGIIVHSEYAKALGRQWYTLDAADDWAVIPLLRTVPPDIERSAIRERLGIPAKAFVVVSIGFIDPIKCTGRLLEAWLESPLAADPLCLLVFVGQNHGGEYGQQLTTRIRHSGLQDRIRITGWAEPEEFNGYLAAADVGVQLRALSRGETSAAILDCMRHGLATIANANGSMAELPRKAVLLLPDEFTNDQLSQALQDIHRDEQKRGDLGTNARNLIRSNHHPRHCADRYMQVIESFYREAATDRHALVSAMADLDHFPGDERELCMLSAAIAASCVPQPSLKQLLVDVTSISRNDLKTGIERVVRAQLLELIKAPPEGFRVEPVYACETDGEWHYRYARMYTCKILGIDPPVLPDEPIDVTTEDVFYAADFSPGPLLAISRSGLFNKWKLMGVSLNVLVYDLLPALRPVFFPDGANKTHEDWLTGIAEFADRLICISDAVAAELRAWLTAHPPSRSEAVIVDSIHLGADIEASNPTVGLPADAPVLLPALRSRPNFLMVGTIEPRKGHSQTISAFERLWTLGQDINLTIVGAEGWTHLADHQRRTIPEIVARIRGHSELGRRLFWLDRVSDEYLDEIYKSSDCLIAAGESEGFGLPLIEAAQHGLPIIARDIPVFREVAATHAMYFSGTETIGLADSVMNWLSLRQTGSIPMSSSLPWSTWAQSARSLTDLLTGKRRARRWCPESVRRKAMNEHLNLIHAARVKMVSTLLPPAEYILDLGGANAPLHRMGYPHPFKKLLLIDLPPEQRHDLYREIAIDADSSLGEVVVRYGDMTNLEGIEDESVDLVWSGQTIEHVSLEDGERMCRETLRVLRKGGAFCLDTPNRRLTAIHTLDVGGGFIHPDHRIEYSPDQLRELLIGTGFHIEVAYGICEMPETLTSGCFHYEDFLYGQQITAAVPDAYIQFYHCSKPR